MADQQEWCVSWYGRDTRNSTPRFTWTTRRTWPEAVWVAKCALRYGGVAGRVRISKMPADL